MISHLFLIDLNLLYHLSMQYNNILLPRDGTRVIVKHWFSNHYLFTHMFLLIIFNFSVLLSIFILVCSVFVRMGRWWRIKEAKNGLYIIPLKRKPEESEVV